MRLEAAAGGARRDRDGQGELSARQGLRRLDYAGGCIDGSRPRRRRRISDSSATFQPITSFRIGLIGAADELETVYGRPVSFGILRWEFDEYLLRRSGARLKLGTPVQTIRRDGEDGSSTSASSHPMLVGAGGHFCPVARWLNPSIEHAPLVVAQEVEFRVESGDAGSFAIANEDARAVFLPRLEGLRLVLPKGRVHQRGTRADGFTVAARSARRFHRVLEAARQDSIKRLVVSARSRLSRVRAHQPAGGGSRSVTRGGCRGPRVSAKRRRHPPRRRIWIAGGRSDRRSSRVLRRRSPRTLQRPAPKALRHAGDFSSRVAGAAGSDWGRCPLAAAPALVRAANRARSLVPARARTCSRTILT